ncbi:MerR family transcriptional regulator [Nesterenkonia sp. MY13]|uniref:MerR family transcriptional regulator n=2 Tax=Nesterenkonia TaxID=57494 RepID=A0A7X8TK45_9MICC|nr:MULTISPECIES: MerR family transcriptional regulator [Micrococcaceae]MBO0596297.1 MerR family transcriptional regulator [Nesterenkonia sp. E16_10]MBO0599997.1 MerR family transcriptional regulator [Nesterenkonia sp. E16_7]NLS09827.1 MerR family transcriptional regulator [Nesterenkonia sedimenti]WBL20293.1 MerR family transcriptional regulator [Citricoccus sp. NR2]GGE78989.1 heavy metal-responsive transcriptional regulator [Nesterenkonia cremea]
MRISEVTAHSGVPATALRYYEQLGLISSTRSINGYREYGPEALERLRFIRVAKKMDMDLEQIKWLLEVTETGTCTNTRDALHPVLTERLREVEDSIRNLEELRAVLVSSIDHVATCPDSSAPCQSECAFTSLT